MKNYLGFFAPSNISLTVFFSFLVLITVGVEIGKGVGVEDRNQGSECSFLYVYKMLCYVMFSSLENLNLKFSLSNSVFSSIIFFSFSLFTSQSRTIKLK